MKSQSMQALMVVFYGESISESCIWPKTDREGALSDRESDRRYNGAGKGDRL